MDAWGSTEDIKKKNQSSFLVLYLLWLQKCSWESRERVEIGIQGCEVGPTVSDPQCWHQWPNYFPPSCLAAGVVQRDQYLPSEVTWCGFIEKRNVRTSAVQRFPPFGTFLSLVLGVAGGRNAWLEIFTCAHLRAVFHPLMLHPEVKVYRLWFHRL